MCVCGRKVGVAKYNWFCTRPTMYHDGFCTPQELFCEMVMSQFRTYLLFIVQYTLDTSDFFTIYCEAATVHWPPTQAWWL